MIEELILQRKIRKLIASDLRISKSWINGEVIVLNEDQTNKISFPFGNNPQKEASGIVDIIVLELKDADLYVHIYEVKIKNRENEGVLQSIKMRSTVH